MISGLAFDRQTRLGLAYYSYSTGGCLCDEDTRPGLIELSPKLIAEAGRRSNAEFMALYKTEADKIDW